MFTFPLLFYTQFKSKGSDENKTNVGNGLTSLTLSFVQDNLLVTEYDLNWGAHQVGQFSNT